MDLDNITPAQREEILEAAKELQKRFVAAMPKTFDVQHIIDVAEQRVQNKKNMLRSIDLVIKSAHIMDEDEFVDYIVNQQDNKWNSKYDSYLFLFHELAQHLCPAMKLEEEVASFVRTAQKLPDFKTYQAVALKHGFDIQTLAIVLYRVAMHILPLEEAEDDE